jgi:hypothetical protein
VVRASGGQSVSGPGDRLGAREILTPALEMAFGGDDEPIAAVGEDGQK